MTVIVTAHVAVMDIFFLQNHTTMTQSMPPGCGKTQILTERIRRAHDQGIAYGDMLCLTFTNRAARGMRERIAQYIEGADLSQLYVGNIHKYCSRFLSWLKLSKEKIWLLDN